MPRTRVETRARARALQALYAWDLRGGSELQQVATRTWDDLGIAPEERRLAAKLVETLVASGAALDVSLSGVTANWRLERLSVIDRSILRLGAAELHRRETPPKVVIQEAVHLAERYGGVQSAKFVNGVLDALARQAGRL